MRKGTIGDFSEKLNFWHELIYYSLMCAESNGSIFNIDHKHSYDHFYVLGWIHSLFGNQIFFYYNLYVSFFCACNYSSHVPIIYINMNQKSAFSNQLRNRKMRDLNFSTLLKNEILSSMVPFRIAGHICMAGIIEYYVETINLK